MAVVLSYLLYGFAIVTLIMAMGVTRKKAQGWGDNYLFCYFNLGSTLWSLCFGLLLIQTDVEKAYQLRCVGMVGMFSYLIFATFLMARWSKIKGRYIKVIKYFPLTAILLYPFLMQRKNITFRLSEYGMSYVFEAGIWNDLYTLYCVLVAASMIFLVIHMSLNKRRKAIRVLGVRLLLCEFVIILGMLFDTIFPMFGMEAFPGSTITQFFGAVLMYQAYEFYKGNSVTVNNMSRFVYYSVDTPVLIYDEEKRLKIVNKNAVEFFQLPAEHGDIALTDLFELEENVLQDGVAQMRLDVQCKVKDAYCRLVINKIPDQYEEVLGYIIIVDDLTDQMQIIEELKEARKHADMANRAKSSFLTKMSHEIRTPLNTVLGMDEMILRESKSEKILEYAAHIKNSGKILLRLINDILDLSKLESGKTRLIEDTYCLADVLHDIINMVSLKRKEKGLALELNIAENIPTKLYGDELRVKQIITNVINNAVKYTDKGKISLRLSWKLVSEDQIELSVQIEDTGKGIRKEDMAKLFAPYERLDEEQNRLIEGSGLGLSITKDLLELMDGRMEVESEYGKGSIFTLHFMQKVLDWTPIGLVTEEELLPCSNDRKRKGNLIAPDVRVLVVDDTISNLVIIQRLLQRTKIRVDMAKSGKDGLRMIAKKQYQIIFLDHMMPEMDGIETLQEIKKLEDNPNSKVPVIALTANAVLGAKDSYLQSGFTDYLSKPVDALALEDMIIQYLPEGMYTIEEVES